MSKQGTLTIESKNIFTILKRWLYAEQDIVFRELVSNAMDAVEKRQLEEPEAAGEVEVLLDKASGQLIIRDNGIGMSADEVERYINQIAFSGAEDFIRRNAQAGDAIIGHFGVGFYSAFMLTDHVSIETKSYGTNEAPVHWDCRADMCFSMEEGSRCAAGTDVILHLPEGSAYLAQPQLIFEELKKYFLFACVPLYFTVSGEEMQQVNSIKPLWRQARESIDEAEMTAFYQEIFQDSAPPLHWFQFSSLDLGLRGVFFLRSTKNGADDLDGTVKVYCRGVYVGENIKGLIPKFVNLQSGIIECDRLPLVVSRGDVRSEEEGDINALVSECLTQEMTIELNELFTNQRIFYEQHWKDLNAFVKYAIMQDKTFASVMTRKVIFEDIYGKYHSIAEYTATQDGEAPIVYYASDKLDQSHYIEIFRKLGENALLFDHVIDQALLFKYASVYPKLRFIRIDSNAVAAYHGALLPEDEARSTELEGILRNLLCERLANLSVQFTRLDSAQVCALIVNDEDSRRMADMMELYGYLAAENTDERERQSKSALLLNLNHPMLDFFASSNDESARALAAHQLLDLALLSQQLLKPEDMPRFLSRSEELLQMFTLKK